MKKWLILVFIILTNNIYSQDECDCYKKYGVKVEVMPYDFCDWNSEYYKGMKEFFACMCACKEKNKVNSLDLKINNLLTDKSRINEFYEDEDNLKYQYIANVVYKINLSNGIKINTEIEDLKIGYIEYEGKFIPKKILDSLNIDGDEFGWINIKTGKVVINSYYELQNGFTYKSDLFSVNFPVENIFGSTTEVKINPNQVKEIIDKLHLNTAEEFNEIDFDAKYDKITFFDIPLLENIKAAMNNNKNAEEILKKKQKEVKALTPNNKLSVEQLKRKLQLLNELVAGGIIHCITFESCNKDIKDVEYEILKREKDSNIADIITEIKNLNPNSNLSIEQLKKKRKLLEDLKNIDDCKTYKICDSEILNVQDEIEKRFDVNSMTEEEIVVWLKYFLEQNIYYEFFRKRYVVEIMNINRCEIKYKIYNPEIRLQERSTKTYSIPIKNTLLVNNNSFFLEQYLVKQTFINTNKIIEKNSSFMFTIDSKIDNMGINKLSDAIKHLATFCKE